MPDNNIQINVTAEDKASAVIQASLEHAQQGYESLAQFEARQRAETEQLAAAETAAKSATDGLGEAKLGAATKTNAFTKELITASLAVTAIQASLRFVPAS